MSSKKLDFPEINLRIEKILGKLGLSKQKEAAKVLEISEGYLSQIITGAVPPSLKILKILQKKSGCNYHWLLTGEEEKGVVESPEAIREHISLYGTSKRQEIIDFLNENPKNEDLVLRVVRLKKEARGVLATLQEDIEPEPTKS